ncbi:hypothetical protein AHF37_08277 [Paragonimus kellicotti]|nr:hypothetical protein AHF37_08277 [Paragonimus kellicotti]
MPPLLALHLRRNGRFPESTLKAVESLSKCDTPETVREGSGFLLLTRMWEDPTSFKMPRVQYVGRPSLSFYGKYLSEIAKNLKTRGIGRVVVKETETAKYIEPCFYVLSRIEPLMSDTVPLMPSSNEQSRIHPPYTIASSDGLIRKRQLDRDFYYIRRSDTPGLYWKVITTKSSVQAEIPTASSDQNFPSAAPPQETKSSES